MLVSSRLNDELILNIIIVKTFQKMCVPTRLMKHGVETFHI